MDEADIRVRYGRRTKWLPPLIVIVLAFVLIGGHFIAKQISAGASNRELVSLRDSVTVAANLVNSRVESDKELIESIASAKISEKDGYGGISTLNRLYGVLRIGYVTTDGRQTIISDDETNGKVIDVSDEPFFPRVMAGEFFVQGASYDKLYPERQTFCYAAPVVVSGEIKGAVTVTFPTDVMSDLLEKARLNENAVMFLLHGDDDILSANDEAIDSFSSELIALNDAENGVVNYTNKNRASDYAARADAGRENLYVASFISGSTGVFENVRGASIWIVAASLFIIAVFILLSVALSKRIKTDRDISRRLNVKEEECRLATDKSDRFILKYYHASGKLLLPDDAARLFGLSPEIRDIPSAIDAIAEPGAKDSLNGLIESIKKPEASGGADICLIVTPGAQKTWYHASFVNTRDENNKPYCAVISLEEITKLRKRIENLEKWREEQKSFIKEKSTILEWNLLKDEFNEHSGRLIPPILPNGESKLDDYMLAYAKSCVYDDDRSAFLAMLKRERLIGAYYDDVTSDGMDYRCLTGEDYKWMRVTVRLVARIDGEEVKLFIALFDIDEEKRASILEYEKANTDKTTGAINLASFEQRVDYALSASGATEQHAVIMMDVNEYDQASGSYIHATSDAALKDLVARVKTALLHDDIIGRIGKEEFMLFLKDIPYDAIVGQKLRHICEMFKQSAYNDMTLRVNLGVAMYPQDGTTYNELYQNAYAALYRIKERDMSGYAFFSGRLYNSDDDAPQLSARQHSKHMLVACSDERDREAFSSAFEDSYRIVKAKDGDGVMIQLKRYASSIGCIILDTEITGTNCYEVMSYIRKNEAYMSIPIIVVSPRSDPQAQLDAISSGACDFLCKPIDIGLLRIKVLCAIKRVDNDLLRVQRSYSLFQSSHEERYRRVLDATGTLVFTHDLSDDRYVYGADTSKYLSGNFDARSLDKILIEDCRASVSKVTQMMLAARRVAQSTGEDESAQYALRLMTPAGDMHWFRAQFIKMNNAGELTRKMLITFNDINDEMEASETLKFRAERDMLTRLYNTETFYEKVKEMVLKKPVGEYTLCSVDVDNFKVLNDQYGRAEGDKLLIFIALLLREAIEPVGGICCRVSADNFAYLFPNSAVSTKFVLRTIEKKCAEYSGPTSFKLSTGAYVIDDITLPIDLIYDRASIAKKSIKGNYINHIAYYTDYMRDEILVEQGIVAQMENALKEGQFEVYLQPQFALDTSFLVSAEALVRWNHPDKGIISPGQFIPIFEKNGFISRLDRYVWEKTLSILKGWIDEGVKVVPLSINVSRTELLEHDFFDYITGIIEKYGVAKELFNVEITETAFAGTPEIIVDTVKRLKNYGIVVEIDDFGSGYSSLNTLKDVPADILKLDMRFMEDSGDASRGGAIVNSIIRMARWLNMSVIAEGVETHEQADFLKSIGCRYAQGYLYAHPMKVSEFEQLKDTSKIGEISAGLASGGDSAIDEYWDPGSHKTFTFNNLNQAVAIAEYSANNGALEIIRANEMFLMGFSAYLMTGATLLGSDVFSLFTEKSVPVAKQAVEKAFETGDSATFNAKLTPEMGSAKLQVTLDTLNKTTDCTLIRMIINDVQST